MSTSKYSVDDERRMEEIDLERTNLRSSTELLKPHDTHSNEFCNTSKNLNGTPRDGEYQNLPSSNSKNWVQFDDNESTEVTLDKTSPSVLPASTNTFPEISNISPSQRTKPKKCVAVDSDPLQIHTKMVDVTPAVLETENSNDVLNKSVSTKTTLNASASRIEGLKSNVGKIDSAPEMRIVQLPASQIHQGFTNGDLIVTLLPTNKKLSWITPATFRPELVPEELMAQGLTLTVEEYVNAMETLINDFRFTAYNICYKRVLVCWILLAFCVLLAILFSGLQGIALFSLGVGWLFINAAAIFFCIWIKLRLSRGLEKCLAHVNKQLVNHKILLVLDDRGRISCHKVNLCFIYFDAAQCISYLNDYIEKSEQSGSPVDIGWERFDLNLRDIVIQGNTGTRISRKQDRALLLYLRYGSRWGNEVVRGLGQVTRDEPARHCAQFICACQYIERHLSCKPRGPGSSPQALHNNTETNFLAKRVLILHA